MLRQGFAGQDLGERRYLKEVGKVEWGPLSPPQKGEFVFCGIGTINIFAGQILRLRCAPLRMTFSKGHNNID